MGAIAPTSRRPSPGRDSQCAAALCVASVSGDSGASATAPEGGRILLAWSAAGGAVPAAEHTEAIQKACAQGFYGFVSNPATKDADVLPHASVSRLVRTLEQTRKTGKHIAVLHLLCHGTQTPGSFGLSLDGEDGRTVVDGQELRQVLAPFSGMVRLVVLSACDSGNTGELA